MSARSWSDWKELRAKPVEYLSEMDAGEREIWDYWVDGCQMSLKEVPGETIGDYWYRSLMERLQDLDEG
jgi:hypothetical protein